LREQHASGRKLTALIEQATANGLPAKKDDRKRLAGHVRAFTRMYRPHAAREDTVLLPDFRALVTAPELEALGAEAERGERELFGDDGFERKVSEVGELEMVLDLSDLARVTP